MKSIAVILLAGFCAVVGAQIPAIPEPPLILVGTVTEAANNQPVVFASVVWQVSDGTANRSYSAASLPATRVVSDSGQSFYVLEVAFDTRIIQTASGALALPGNANALEVCSPSANYTLTAVVNGQVATVKSVGGGNQTAGTPAHTFNAEGRGRGLGRRRWRRRGLGGAEGVCQ